MASSPFRWTVPVLKHFDARVAALVGVPHAQDHEAPNSWLTRVAALQGCDSAELAAYLGFTFRADFDRSYYFVFRKVRSEAPQVRGLELGRIYTDSSPRHAAAGRWMSSPSRHRGRYRFCPLCLKFDQVPCMHLYARVQELVFCPWHRCLLEEQCPNCNAHVELMQDMATAGPRRMGVGDLSLCLSCGGRLDAMAPLPMDFEFVRRLPHWLREWGRHGPEVVQGPGMSLDQLWREVQRLSNPPAPMSDLVALQRKSMSTLLATTTGAPVRARVGPTPPASHDQEPSGLRAS
ncbi:TniQ family protein [Roseateles cellulosilyticus]|uniref:TniQ family protein n=1 Tax=Pelomonas cellulosilytica TaxID=2906762 RepID=A0ABS8XXT5_9BURK|nr:TniQ family protein [Pelomonas sp. P8]MCE4555586.1 TniQ family protein [Pelomonas sp. P8]